MISCFVLAIYPPFENIALNDSESRQDTNFCQNQFDFGVISELVLHSEFNFNCKGISRNSQKCQEEWEMSKCQTPSPSISSFFQNVNLLS